MSAARAKRNWAFDDALLGENCAREVWTLTRKACRFRYVNKSGREMCRFYGFAPCKFEYCPVLFGDLDAVEEKIRKDG